MQLPPTKFLENSSCGKYKALQYEYGNNPDLTYKQLPHYISLCVISSYFLKCSYITYQNQTIEYVVTKDGGNQHSNKFFCNGKSHEFKASTTDTRMLINEMYLRECENYFVSSLIVL